VRTLISRLNEGGQLFLCDVRSLPLLDAYHTSVQLWQAEDDTSREAFADRVRQRIDQEEELLIDPEFFRNIESVLPQASRVELQLKRGEIRNEMSCFRYDAIITLNGKAPENAHGSVAPERVEWHSINDENKLAERLKECIDTPGSLLITGIPDARLRPEIVAMGNMANPADQTVADLRMAISEDSTTGVQPETIYRLAEQLDLQLQLIGTAPTSTL